MVNHSIEKRHDSIEKPESVSILFCSSRRSSQNPYVPFELERFQFFLLTASSRVHSKERFFQGVEGKGLQVIMSLFFLSHFLVFFICITWVFCFTVSSQSSFMLCLTCFLFVVFSFFYFVFHIKIKIKIEKSENTKIVCVLCTLVLVYLGWPLKQNFLNFVSFVA